MTRAGNSLSSRTSTLVAALAGGVTVLALAVLIPACGVGRAGQAAPFDALPDGERLFAETSDSTTVAGSPGVVADERAARLDEREAELAAMAARLDESRAELAAAREALRAAARDRDVPPVADVDVADGPAPVDDAATDLPDDLPATTAPFPRRSAPDGASPAAGNASPVASIQPLLVTLEPGTSFDVELLDGVSSERSATGDVVTAAVASDVVVDGLVVVPAGSRLSGRVDDAVSQKKIGGQARLLVAFDRLEIPGGDAVPVSALLAAEGEKQTRKDAAILAGSTAGGALLGRVLKKSDRSKGTLIGAVVGAAVGATIAAKNEKDVIELPVGTVASLELDAPVQVAVARSAGTLVAGTR